jgi:hypothetical protein
MILNNPPSIFSFTRLLASRPYLLALLINCYQSTNAHAQTPASMFQWSTNTQYDGIQPYYSLFGSSTFGRLSPTVKYTGNNYSAQVLDTPDPNSDGFFFSELSESRTNASEPMGAYSNIAQGGVGALDPATGRAMRNWLFWVGSTLNAGAVTSELSFWDTRSANKMLYVSSSTPAGAGLDVTAPFATATTSTFEIRHPGLAATSPPLLKISGNAGGSSQMTITAPSDFTNGLTLNGASLVTRSSGGVVSIPQLGIGLGNTAPTAALDVVGSGKFSNALSVSGTTTLSDAMFGGPAFSKTSHTGSQPAIFKTDVSPDSLMIKASGQLDLLAGLGSQYRPNFLQDAIGIWNWDFSTGVGSIIGHQPASASTAFSGNVFGFGQNSSNGRIGQIQQYSEDAWDIGRVTNCMYSKNNAIWNYCSGSTGVGVQILSGNTWWGSAIRINDEAAPKTGPWYWVASAPGLGNGDQYSKIQLGNGRVMQTYILPNLGIGTRTPAKQLDVVGEARITGGLTVTGSLTVSGESVITRNSTGISSIPVINATTAIGIGLTTAPTASLDVNGSGKFAQNVTVTGTTTLIGATTATSIAAPGTGTLTLGGKVEITGDLKVPARGGISMGAYTAVP